MTYSTFTVLMSDDELNAHSFEVVAIDRDAAIADVHQAYDGLTLCWCVQKGA